MVHLGKNKRLIRENLYARDIISKIYSDKIKKLIEDRERLEAEVKRLEKESVGAHGVEGEKLECEKVMSDALEDSESWHGIVPCALTATVIYFIIWCVAELLEFITK